jgi:hypothetical protein
MEGIMNLPANVGGATSQDGLDSYAPLIAAQQTARDMGYPRFTRELLAAGSEIDQAEVQEFLQTIRDAGLTSDDVAMMRRVVEAVFGDPNNYPQVRGRLLAEGVPEDILPETFDLEFFVALRMAVEEAENLSQESRPTGQGMAMEAPVGMAEGGIVGLPQMTPIAREMAAMGRNGDTMLAHITPQEAMMLKSMGGSGTINPYTGLPEFFIGKLFKSVGKLFKSVVKGIKKFAKSTVGRIIISVALGAFLGPAAAGFLGVSSAAGLAAVTAGVGSFGSSILAGDSLKSALLNGLSSAALAGGISAISGGSAALQERPEFNQAYKDAGGFRGTVSETASKYFDAPVDTAKQLYGTETVQPDAAIQAAPTAADLQTVAPPATDAISAQTANAPFLDTWARDPSSFDYSDQAFGATSGGATPPAVTPVTRGAPVAQSSVGAVTPVSSQAANAPFLDTYARDPSSFDYSDQAFGATSGGATTLAPTTEPNLFERAYDTASNYLSPNRPSIQGRSADTIFKELTLPKNQGGQFGFTSTPDTLKLATEMAAKEAPGTFAKYGPITAVAGTTLAATGGLDSLFKAPGQEPGESYEAYMARRQAAEDQFRQERPEFFGSLTSGPSYYSPPIYSAKGSGPEGVKNFPRKNGHISGPGTGMSDDIPAMLSDGEFVFTAQSVRNMGGGSRRKGAARMYKMMKMLEGGPIGKTAKA